MVLYSTSFIKLDNDICQVISKTHSSRGMTMFLSRETFILQGYKLISLRCVINNYVQDGWIENFLDTK